MVLSVIGWPLALACFAVAACAIWRGLYGREQQRRAGALITALIFLTAAFADLAVLGVVSPLTGGILAGAAAVAAVLMLQPWRPGAAGLAWGHVADGAGWLRDDTRSLWQRLTGRADGGDNGTGPAPGPVPIEAVAEHVATRAIPSVMDDPHLGPALEPAAIAQAGIPVPAPYAALAQFIGGFEPEDDQALRMFMEGCAMGSTVVGEAWHHFADTILNGVGLSPAYVAGILEAGDSAGEHASLLAQVHKRFGVVYAAVKEWISAHGPLPHKARDFLTDSD